jgi:hypothetical protein
MASTNFVNGSTILPAWLNDVNTITYLNSVNAKIAGAVGNGVTDDTMALNVAISSANSLGIKNVFLPPGNYFISSALNITSGISFTGAGRNCTTISWSNTAMNCLTITTTDQCIISGILFAAPLNCTAGSSISLTGSGGVANAFSQIKDNEFSNGFNQFTTTNAYAWSCKNNYFGGAVSSPIIAQNVVSPDAGDSTIEGNILSSFGTIGILQTSSGGLRIINNKILNGTTGIALNLLPNDSTSILLVTGNSIELSSSSAISLTFGSSSHFSVVNIIDNECSQVPIGISIPGSGSTVALTNVNINDNIISLTSSGTAGIIINNVSNNTIDGNTIIGNGGTPTGIIVGGFSTQGRIGGSNSIQGCSTKISNGSGTTFVSPNFIQTGMASITTSTSRGSLFLGTASITFPIVFDSIPTITCDPGTISGGISAWATSITNTGFTLNAISVTSGGAGNANYNAIGFA